MLPIYYTLYYIVGTFICILYTYMWKFAYHAVLSSTNWPAGRQNTEASARVEDDVYVLHAVYRCYWALRFYYLYRKITGVIIISNYGHYNYRPSTFITYCLRVRRTYIWRWSRPLAKSINLYIKPIEYNIQFFVWTRRIILYTKYSSGRPQLYYSIYVY